MAALTLVSVQAIPAIATRNSAGIVARPGVSTYIWTPTINYNDPLQTDGSTNPVTFQIPSSKTALYVPTITWNATCVFTQPYAGKAYSIIASLPIGNEGALVPIFQSTGKMVAPDPIPSPPPLVQLQCAEFELVSGLNVPPASPVPFRVAGDFIWKLSFGSLPDINATLQKTRLEFNWAVTTAPAGPTSTNNTFGITCVNLGAIYPISLCRLFFPAAIELVNILNPDQDYGRSYAKRVVQRVWTWGNPFQPNRPFYDAMKGASFYNVGSGGGSFNLAGWVAGIASKYINGNELLNSRWVFQSPNAFIKPCVLYGWGTKYPYPNGVNNPFFQQQSPENPYVAPPDMTNRFPFGNHAWLEVQAPYQPTTRWVLDATTAIPDASNNCYPEVGTRSRPEYATAHTDAAADPSRKYTGNTTDKVKGLPTSNGNCYTNFDWYIDTPGQNKYGRIGVLDASGVTPPIYLPLILSASLPDNLVSEMEMLLAKGTNPTPTTAGFNDSAIANGSLLPVVTGSESSLSLQNHETRVAEGVTVLHMIFTEAKYSETQKAKLFVELQVFDTKGFANAALIHALSGHQIPNLSETFDRPSPALGQISLVDKYGHSLYLVRGNLYLSLKLSPLSPDATFSDISQIEQLQPIAQRLDTYLAAQTLPPGQQRKPALQLMTPPSSNIRVGDALSLEAQGDDFAIVDGASENCAAVICAGTRPGTQQIDFYAVGEGTSELKVHVAHKETLAPGTETWSITVSASGE